MENQNKILLLKTSPHNYHDIRNMAILLDNHPHIINWSIDLDDSDKVLRIESAGLKVEEIINSLYHEGIWSEDLQD